MRDNKGTTKQKQPYPSIRINTFKLPKFPWAIYTCYAIPTKSLTALFPEIENTKLKNKKQVEEALRFWCN